MIYGRYIGLAAAMHSPDELKLCSWEWVSSSFAFPSCLALAFCLGDQPLFSHYFFGITWFSGGSGGDITVSDVTNSV